MKLQGSKAFALFFAGFVTTSEGFALRANRDEPLISTEGWPEYQQRDWAQLKQVERGEKPSAPDPTVVWVNELAVNPPPSPPSEESCFGCQCLHAVPGPWIVNATLQDQLTCLSGDDRIIPDLRWGGPKDGLKCRSCQSFAVTIEDLDYPNGMGSPDNHIYNIYWIANIPGDWMAINKTAVVELADLAPMMVVGMNGKGKRAMEAACPERGIHRYRVTLWALDSALNDLGASTPYQDLKALFQEHELARVTWHAQLSASKFVDYLAAKRAGAAAAGLAGATTPPPAAAAPPAAAPAQMDEVSAPAAAEVASAPWGSFLGFGS